MAEFDYEVVNGRKIRVRPAETVVSEIDENGYFDPSAKSFYRRIWRRKESGRKRKIPSGMGKALPLVQQSIDRKRTSWTGRCDQCQHG